MKYSVAIIKGEGRGKLLGFPTFNLKIPKNFDAKQGIYACWVKIGGKKYQGALHFGPIPVFNQSKISLEVFLLDYKPTNYPITQLTIELVKFLRPVKSFPSAQALKQQIAEDVDNVRQLLS